MNQKGQAVLIVILVMAVVLTVVLSIVASSTSDIKLSTTESESLRAFSAAEAGIEKALIGNTTSNGTVDNATYNASVGTVAEGQTKFNYPSDLVSGDGGIIWFVSHNTDGSLVCDTDHPCFTGDTVHLCWGGLNASATSATTPAIEASFFYLTTPGDYSSVKVSRMIFDANATRLISNSYAASDAGTCNINGVRYSFQKVINITSTIPSGSYSIANGLQFLSVRMLYNTDVAVPFGVDLAYPTNSTLPSQGSSITSTGNVNTLTRKIQVTRAYLQVPPIFESAIFGQQGLVQ